MTATLLSNDHNEPSENKKMEGDDGPTKIQCLRGRLLAERQASRTAKENAESMATKITELEKKLAEETKLRKKAEKKLKRLTKKLESLKISGSLEGSEQSSLSDNSCGASCISSVSSSSTKEDSELSSKSITTTPPLTSQHCKDNSQAIENCQNQQSQECLSTQNASHSNSSQSMSIAEVETLEVSTSKEIMEDINEEEYTDNSLALVLVTLPPEPTNKMKTSGGDELKRQNKSVVEVLEALKQARENIQSKLNE